MAGLLGLPALIAGLILALAGSNWFSGAQTVGIILIVIGGLVILLTLLVIAAAVWAAGSKLR